MEINYKKFSIDIQDVKISILNEYISSIKEVSSAIKTIAGANEHISMAVLAQRILIDIGNIDSIIKEAIQNREEKTKWLTKW